MTSSSGPERGGSGPRPPKHQGPKGRPDVGHILFGLAVFVVEILMLVGIYSVVANAVTGPWGVVAGALLVFAVAVFWGFFMAPNARTPLGRNARAAMGAVLCIAPGTALAVEGRKLFGGALILGGLVLAAAQLTRENETTRTPPAAGGEGPTP